jgi:hypothetical protein
MRAKKPQRYAAPWSRGEGKRQGGGGGGVCVTALGDAAAAPPAALARAL